MRLQQAQLIANKYLHQLQPYCEKIEVAGSIRRQKSEVKDIELICIPKKVQTNEDMFAPTYGRMPQFAALVNGLERIKGDPAEGKYCARMLPEGIQLDLFICTRENWGYQLALRTGPAMFSKSLVCKLKEAGYGCRDGNIYFRSALHPVEEEREIFRMLQRDFIPPEYRLG